jgi:hypothetical protein
MEVLMWQAFVIVLLFVNGVVWTIALMLRSEAKRVQNRVDSMRNEGNQHGRQ